MSRNEREEGSKAKNKSDWSSLGSSSSGIVSFEAVWSDAYQAASGTVYSTPDMSRLSLTQKTATGTIHTLNIGPPTPPTTTNPELAVGQEPPVAKWLLACVSFEMCLNRTGVFLPRDMSSLRGVVTAIATGCKGMFASHMARWLE